MTVELWEGLLPGDRFSIESHSGNVYDVTFLARSALPGGGLFLRYGASRLGRFLQERLNWKTFERLPSGDALLPGDEILVQPSGSAERRGQVTEVRGDRIVLRLPRGEPAVVALEHGVRGTIRILMKVSDWQAGDEFIIASRSGREYRGTTLRVEPEHVEVTDLRRDGLPAGARVTLRVEQLDIASLRVLIPIRLGTVAAA